MCHYAWLITHFETKEMKNLSFNSANASATIILKRDDCIAYIKDQD